MSAENVLDKTNRINLLFAFYQQLLTEKQQTFLKLYFHDNFSLGEIAEEFKISRQAVNEHIKRAEFMLEEYEGKLRLLLHHEQRHTYIQQINHLLAHQEQGEHTQEIQAIIQRITDLDT